MINDIKEQMIEIYSNNLLSLGDRQKDYERLLDKKIPNGYPYIIRLDGKTFSKRVKGWGMSKPFDNRFNLCMVATCESLWEHLQNIRAIWTGSDEISIIIDKDTDLFNNRIEKITSITASISSSIFTITAMKLEFKNILENPAWFDSRITLLPNEDEIVNNILFRQHDCIRNSISTYARSYYSTKMLHNKGRADQLNMMLDKQFDWEKDAIDWSKYGVLFFKQYVLKDIATNSEIKVSRYIEDFGEIDEDKYYIRTKLYSISQQFNFNDLKRIIYNETTKNI